MSPTPAQSGTPSGDLVVRRGMSFPRRIRLRCTRDHVRVKKIGRRIRSANFLILATRGGVEWSRVGFAVSRKVGNAVTRNRVKRKLREAFRKHYALLQGSWDLVFIAHPSAAGLDGLEIAHEVAMLFSRIGAAR